VHCGFHRVFLGIETPDSGSLQQAGKHQNLRHPLVQAVRTIRSMGLQVMAGFILGFDGETPGAGERITAFVEATAIPLAMVGVLQALPNTALWQRLAAEGRLLEGEGTEGVDQGIQTHLLNFRPSRPMREIAAEFLACFDALYEPQAYLERAWRSCLQQGSALDPAERHQAAAFVWQPGLGRALLALLWRQGVRRHGRGLFWSRLIALVRRRPRALPDFLWLLLAEEHMLLYRDEVHRQVKAQLASPLLAVPEKDASGKTAPRSRSTPVPVVGG
jgi:radical SAM superfamily enzyme YgiQ (UPF0313 family)